MVSKEKCLAINWHVPPDLPDIVCDRMKLRQMVINLVNNAIKFTDQVRWIYPFVLWLDLLICRVLGGGHRDRHGGGIFAAHLR